MEFPIWATLLVAFCAPALLVVSVLVLVCCVCPRGESVGCLVDSHIVPHTGRPGQVKEDAEEYTLTPTLHRETPQAVALHERGSSRKGAVSPLAALTCENQPQLLNQLELELNQLEMRLSKLVDEETRVSWALKESQSSNSVPNPEELSPREENNDATAGLLSVLTIEEQIEVAKRQSNPSRAAKAVFSVSPDLPYRCAKPALDPKPGDLRLIVLDGANVAHARGIPYNFSVKRLLVAYNYFKENGHDVVIFLPRRLYLCAKPEDQVILNALEEREVLCLVQDLAYDDWFIIEHAHQNQGVIISNDKYRDVLETNPEWCEQILKRTLQFTWAPDKIMIARDPFGKNGPSLDQVLRH